MYVTVFALAAGEATVDLVLKFTGKRLAYNGSCKAVSANRGAGGIDGMQADDLRGHPNSNRQGLRKESNGIGCK